MTIADEQLRDFLTRVDDRTLEIVKRRKGSSTKHRRRWLIHRVLAGADIFGLFVAYFVSLLLADATSTNDVHPVSELAFFALSLPLWIMAFKLKGLYDSDDGETDYSTIDDVAGVFVVVTAGAWLLLIFTSITNVIEPNLVRIVFFWLTAIIEIPLCRLLARMWARTRVTYIQNVVIVGTGLVGRMFAKKIKTHPEYGLHLVGFVDPEPAPGVTEIGSVPVLGSTSMLSDLVEALTVDRVIIAFTRDSPEETIGLIRSIRGQAVQIDIVPRLFEVIGTNSTMHMIEGTQLVGLPRFQLSPSSRILKRMLDLALTIPALVILAPLLVVVAVAIKIDSRGPVIFRQVRRGEGESTFEIFKFRSMVADADDRKAEVAHLNMHVDEDSRMFKVPDDPRMTRVGAFLRRYSIDELPQLFNVLRGEMSLVGPRPLILEEDQYVVDWARKRLSIRPGVTGLWQVLGRSDIPFDEMTKLDYLYVTSWSLKQDIRLILLTIPALFRSRRAQ